APYVGTTLMLAVLSGVYAQAEDFNETNSKITIHAPDGWKRSPAKETDEVMKLTLEKGVATHSDDYYVLKIGHLVSQKDDTLEGFKDGMIKGFPADWKALDVTKVTIGKQKLPALRVAYNFQAVGITFRLDLFLLRRGVQFTFF